MTVIEPALLAAAALVVLAILASKASQRFGIPALLLFLVIGMLAGSDGPGGIWFDDARLAQSIAVVALVIILFSGGMSTDWTSIRPVLGSGISLATLGVFVTSVLTGWFATVVLGLSWLEGLLLGAIVSSTDAAAVFSVLRTQRIGLAPRVGPLLELESGSNDPMAVFLTVAFTRLLTEPGLTVWSMVPFFLLQMGVGAALGLAAGRVIGFAINRLNLQTEGLYPVFTLGAVLFTYAGTTLIGGSGFLAVYLAGIVLANGTYLHKRSLQRFHDGLAWLMQIAMFLTLGLLVFPSRILPVAGVALLISLFLIFVARPVSVFAGLAGTNVTFRHKLFVSWVGLRGAVPIVLATFPLLAGVPRSDVYFNVVFFIVLTSVLLQGTTIPFAARLLRLAVPLPSTPPYPIEFAPTSKTRSDMVELTVAPGSVADGRRIMDLGFPRSALVVLIGRGDGFITPRGGTHVRAGDTLLVMADREDIETVRSALSAGTS